MTVILGISGFYHDAAAAVLVDGQLAAAAQEERFSRIKFDARFPVEASRACLKVAGFSADEVDLIGYYEKPLQKFDRLMQSYLDRVPKGRESFTEAAASWVSGKLDIGRRIREGLKETGRTANLLRPIYAEHHQSHAASAFFPSPFEEAAILTLDGVGEWTCGSWGTGRGNHIALRQCQRFPHSLGMLYSAFTAYCGFKVLSGEYKLMGLAAYGRPRYRDKILESLIDMKSDGSFRLDLKYFDFADRLRMTNDRFAALFGGPAREPEGELDERTADLAASIQAVAEDVVLRQANYVHQQTGLRRLCYAGGVALNCLANGRLLREGPFDEVWIQPAAGDAGGAAGVAWWVWHQVLKQPRTVVRPDAQRGSFLGPAIESPLDLSHLPLQSSWSVERLTSAEMLEQVAARLAAGEVLGWVQGRMEYGPRALGARSILADPRRPEMKDVLNAAVKRREAFRPFAAAVLADEAATYFDCPTDQEQPYMLVTCRVRRPEAIPAVTHADGSCRIQTVSADNPLLEPLLRTFNRITGTPVLINTSLNVRGEPIVCTAADAVRCFADTGLDAIAIGDVLVSKLRTAVEQGR